MASRHGRTSGASLIEPLRAGLGYARPTLAMTDPRPHLGIAALVVSLAWVQASPASAQPRSACDSTVDAWVARCARLADDCVKAVLCPPGGVVLDSGCEPDGVLRVEVAEGGERSFRDVGAAGLSPVGSYSDWSSVDAGKRDRFEELAACLAADASLVVEAPDPAAARTPAARDRTPTVPWRVLLAVGLALTVAGERLKTREARRTALALVSLCVATFALRAWLAPWAFFHQNGQGAFWVAFALDPHGDRTSYGPGYSELFGWASRVFVANPERGVFGFQALLAATVPASGFVVLRGLGARRGIAALVALLLAASPTLARIAQSESYYATYTALLFAAAATFVVGAASSRRSFALAVLSAGFFVAQVARVTPIGWTAAAVLPFVLLAREGSARERALRTLEAGLGIGLVVVLSSGPAMLGVLRGSVGRQWGPEVGLSLRVLASSAPALVLVGAFLVAASRQRAATTLSLLGATVAAALFEVSFLVGASPPTVHHAFLAMWLVTGIALVAGVVRDLRAPELGRIVAGIALLALVATFPAQSRAAFTLPTDVLEARFVERLRDRLPPRSTVLYVGRSGLSVLTLPLYGGQGSARPTDPRGWSLRVEEPLPELGAERGPFFYYESSLCDLAEARAFCRRARERFSGRTVAERTLPLRNPYARYVHRSLRVRLVRVR